VPCNPTVSDLISLVAAAPPPDKRGILHGHIGRERISFKYVTLKNETRVELLFQTEDAKEQLHKLKQNREAIEAAFGGRLEWL
jgi:hypothetical protein